MAGDGWRGSGEAWTGGRVGRLHLQHRARGYTPPLASHHICRSLKFMERLNAAFLASHLLVTTEGGFSCEPTPRGRLGLTRLLQVCVCVCRLTRYCGPLSGRDGLSFTVFPPTAETAACTRPARAWVVPGVSATSLRRPSYTPTALWLLPLNDDADGDGGIYNTLRPSRDLFHLH